MSLIKEKIQADLKAAMLSKNQAKVDAIRMLTAAIKQKEVDSRIAVTDEQILDIINKLLKQRKESAQLFEQGGRLDLVAKEKFEIEILAAYLPEQLAEAELLPLIQQAIQASNATSAKDLGKVIKILEPQLKGRADMSLVVAKIKELLA